jgi:hypothetical protein
MDEESFQYETYRVIDSTRNGYELRVTPPDLIERKVQKHLLILNPDQDACKVTYLVGSSDPGRQRIIKRAEADELRSSEKVSVIPFSTDLLAYMIDVPYRGNRIIIQPMTEQLNEVMHGFLARANLDDQAVPMTEADKILDGWNQLWREGKI